MGKLPVPMPAPEEILRLRRRQRRNRRVLGMAVLLAAALWLLTQTVLIARNEGLSMYPAVKDGDLVLAWRWSRTWQRDDLVLYRQDGNPYLGRIAAQAGDVVRMDGSGRLMVNGSVRSEEVFYPTYARDNVPFLQRIPEGSVFVLGDFRTQSQDSRDFGPISLTDIQGRVFAIARFRHL